MLFSLANNIHIITIYRRDKTIRHKAELCIRTCHHTPTTGLMTLSSFSSSSLERYNVYVRYSLEACYEAVLSRVMKTKHHGTTLSKQQAARGPLHNSYTRTNKQYILLDRFSGYHLLVCEPTHRFTSRKIIISTFTTFTKAFQKEGNKLMKYC